MQSERDALKCPKFRLALMRQTLLSPPQGRAGAEPSPAATPAGMVFNCMPTNSWCKYSHCDCLSESVALNCAQSVIVNLLSQDRNKNVPGSFRRHGRQSRADGQRGPRDGLRWLCPALPRAASWRTSASAPAAFHLAPPHVAPTRCRRRRPTRGGPRSRRASSESRLQVGARPLS